MTNFDIPADPYSTDDLDRAAEHLFRTPLPGSVKRIVASKLDEMRLMAHYPEYFGADRFTLPAEILELPVAPDLIATARAQIVDEIKTFLAQADEKPSGSDVLSHVTRHETLAAIQAERAAKAGA